MTDFKTLSKTIDGYVASHVKKSRYQHSERVAAMCVRLCRLYGLDVDKGWFMGIAHDMCKDMTDRQLTELAEKDGKPIYDMERAKPRLFHGRAAAVMLKEEYGVDEADVLEAIANHVSGEVSDNPYVMVLYVADKIEPGRDHVSEEYRSGLMKLPLEEMFYTVIRDNYDYICSQGFASYPSTERVLKALEEKLGKSR